MLWSEVKLFTGYSIKQVAATVKECLKVPSIPYSIYRSLRYKLGDFHACCTQCQVLGIVLNRNG